MLQIICQKHLDNEVDEVIVNELLTSQSHFKTCLRKISWKNWLFTAIEKTLMAIQKSPFRPHLSKCEIQPDL